MFENILLAYDRSEHSRRAARLAGELARQQPQPRLRVITIVDPIPSELGTPLFNQLIEKRKISGDEALDEAVELIGEGVEIQRAVLFGHAAETIIEVAETRHCDLIVIGSRGLGTFGRLLLGSQTQKVIGMANCPVLVVK